ncbi:MAG TPA: shikimate dehydrogenase [Armatimonadota bacterium]|nr:shikimate dehydrogenase [Armatimonadota bacterium]HOS44128.1 shikimate dehydrogenase [Armatimonadota bacterium]
MRTISPNTQLCAVMGNPVGHSLSPAIHNAGYAALDLDFVYLACRVEDVAAALGGVRALGNFRGLSVTIPHKIEAMRHVDEVAEVDRAIGSINTVVHEGDKLIGFGTDGPGALKALADAGVAVEGRRILMLGAGGAARAIGFTLAWKAAPAELTLLDIHAEMLRGLAADLRAGSATPIVDAVLAPDTLAEAMARAEVVIHCTPIGMHPKVGASLVPAGLFRPEQAVFDIVYTPLETKLLADARARGCRVIPGVEMFLNQAVLQFEYFTGAPAPAAVMRRVLMEQLSR